MIDTVILIVPFGKYKVEEPERFSPPLTTVLSNLKAMKANPVMKYTQNPPKASYTNGNYSPRLTVNVRPANKNSLNRYAYEIPLKIEFSVPKLLYQNNLDELTDADFDSVIDILHIRLLEMGVFVEKVDLAQAQVRAVHFSKNIPISGFNTASLVLKELNKLDVSKKLQIKKRDFEDGQALYFDCNSYAITFYDKIADITQSKRHSVDKEKTSYQLDLFKHFKKSKEPTEILRYELRITSKQKLNSLLKQFGYQKDPTFQEVFNSKLSQKMLLNQWNIIYPNESRFMFKFEENNLDKTFENIVAIYKKNKKRITLKDTMCIYGAMAIAKKEGVRSLKNRLTRTFSARTWYRAKKTLFKDLNLFFLNSESFGFVNDIESSLNSFTPFKAKDLSYIEGAIP